MKGSAPGVCRLVAAALLGGALVGSGMPRAGASADGDTLSVIAISDLNGGRGSTRYRPAVHAAVQRIVELDPDVVLCLGDMVAGQHPGLDYRRMWRAFDRAVGEPLRAAGIPLAVTPGNHDASAYPRYRTERRIFVRRWRARRPALPFVKAEAYPLRYGFRMGPALFVSLDATTGGPLPQEQRRWLKGVLESDPAAHRIVFGHVPQWPLVRSKRREVLADPELEAILRSHGPTVLLSGHHHVFYPARKGSLRVVGVGALGAGHRRLPGDAARAPASFVRLELDANGPVRLQALRGPDFTSVLDLDTLPEQIALGEATLVRHDLASE